MFQKPSQHWVQEEASIGNGWIDIFRNSTTVPWLNKLNQCFYFRWVYFKQVSVLGQSTECKYLTNSAKQNTAVYYTKLNLNKSLMLLYCSCTWSTAVAKSQCSSSSNKKKTVAASVHFLCLCCGRDEAPACWRREASTATRSLVSEQLTVKLPLLLLCGASR